MIGSLPEALRTESRIYAQFRQSKCNKHEDTNMTEETYAKYKALRARRLFRQAETGTNYAADYRYAKKTLLWAFVSLAVFTLHLILRLIYPAGTPHDS